jgi:hypothetical protein
LYLGWLADFDPDEWRDPKDGAVVMPPIPAGLDQLSPALTALIEHFPVDPEALAVAAGLSQASPPDRIPIAAVLESLCVSETAKPTAPTHGAWRAPGAPDSPAFYFVPLRYTSVGHAPSRSSHRAAETTRPAALPPAAGAAGANPKTPIGVKENSQGSARNAGRRSSATPGTSPLKNLFPLLRAQRGGGGTQGGGGQPANDPALGVPASR